jgi:hypothetical protein
MQIRRFMATSLYLYKTRLMKMHCEEWSLCTLSSNDLLMQIQQ